MWALFMFRVVIGAIFGLATMHRSFFYISSVASAVIALYCELSTCFYLSVNFRLLLALPKLHNSRSISFFIGLEFSTCLSFSLVFRFCVYAFFPFSLNSSISACLYLYFFSVSFHFRVFFLFFFLIPVDPSFIYQCFRKWDSRSFRVSAYPSMCLVFVFFSFPLLLDICIGRWRAGGGEAETETGAFVCVRRCARIHGFIIFQSTRKNQSTFVPSSLLGKSQRYSASCCFEITTILLGPESVFFVGE